MDVEHGLICSIVEQGDLQSALECHIKNSFFFDQKHLDIWAMIIDHYNQYGTVVTDDIIHKAYPTYIFSSPPEPIRFYIDQVKDKYKMSLVVEGVNAVMEEFDSGGPNPGSRLTRALQSVIQQINTDLPPGKGIEWWEALEDQLATLQDRMANPGYLRGISTGFDTVDKVTGGLQAEQLITLTAVPKAGKSSFALKVALHASECGNQVMFFTFEMSAQEQQDRLTSLIGGVSLTDVMNGTLSRADYNKVEKAFSLRKNLSGLTIISDPTSVTTVSAIRAQVQQMRPDLVIVDGVYLMDDELGEPKMSPRALTNITQSLKRLAQSEGVPILCSTQSLLSKSKGGVDVHSVGYSSSFVMDSDVILGVDKIPNTTVSKFNVIGSRSGPKIDSYVKVDWATGTIAEMDPAAADLEIQAASNGKSSRGPSLTQVTP